MDLIGMFCTQTHVFPFPAQKNPVNNADLLKKCPPNVGPWCSSGKQLANTGVGQVRGGS